ncbi:MAG: hypothetical protein DMG08_28150, partial [Acidobacteria bacterium]
MMRRREFGQKLGGTVIGAGLVGPATASTRRQFIKQAVTATATLGLLTGCKRLDLANQIDVDPDAIKKFGASLKGRIILPTDPAYERARRVQYWNPKTERRPALVVRCAHADDVVGAVEFARRHGVETAVRAGGHSFQGWGTSNGLVIDLSGMKQMAIDPRKRVGRVDAGVLSGEFVSAA